MFPKNTLYSGASLSSAGSTWAVFPNVNSTTKALRLPAPNTRLLIYSLPRPNSFASWFIPLQRRQPQGVALLILPHALGHHGVGRTQDLAGSQGIRAIPLPCSPTPAGPADLTFTVNSVLSPQFRKRRHQRVLISRLNHTASVSAAYASSSTLPYSHARLASGCWLGSTGREFNPLDSDERF